MRRPDQEEFSMKMALGAAVAFVVLFIIGLTTGAIHVSPPQ